MEGRRCRLVFASCWLVGKSMGLACSGLLWFACGIGHWPLQA